MPARGVRRGVANIGSATPSHAPIYVDSDDNILKIIPAGSGTTEVQVVDASSAQTLTNKTLTAPVIAGGTVTAARTEYLTDLAIGITSHIAVLTKATAGAYTIAAPTAEGQIIDIVSETSAAHVITGTDLFWAGVTGGPFNKVTLTAFPGHHFRLISSNGLWMVLASALGTGTVGD